MSFDKELEKKRWVDGVPHHPKSRELFKFLSKIDFEVYDDYFGWRSGGDGDNGETLMYQLDAYFEVKDKETPMANDPTWLTNLEATARAADTYVNGNSERLFEQENGWAHEEGTFVYEHVVANSPERILALCKLVRELHSALALNLEDFEGEISANENQPNLYNEVATAILGRLAKDNKEVLEAYQLGPVTGEESGG